MIWSEETENALRCWLAPPTSYKEQPIDDRRFFLFIAHVWRDNHCVWDPAAARGKLKQKAKELHRHDNPAWSDAFIDSFLPNRICQGTLILDFLYAVAASGKLNELLSSSNETVI